MSKMVRKQLYITEVQDRALKERAGHEGVSEAELVRRALNHLLEEKTTLPHSRQQKAIDDFLREADELSQHHRLPEDYHFNRDELYGERMERFGRS